MSEYRALLERARTQFPAPELPVETVLRRRDRRRRNRRIGAAVVGLAVAILVFGGLLRELTLERSTPADPDVTPTLAELPSGPEAWARVSFPSSPGDEVLSIAPSGPGLVAFDTSYGYFGDACWTSTDGHTWSPVKARCVNGAILDVTSGGSELIAVGSRDVAWRAGRGDEAPVWTSTDGLTWDAVPSDPVFRGALIRAVAAGGPGFVAAGSTLDGPAAWYSADGVSWEQASVPLPRSNVYVEDGQADAFIKDLAAVEGRLVAVGQVGIQHQLPDGSGGGVRYHPVIWTSTDGLTWTEADTDAFPSTAEVNSVAAGPSGFVAVGGDQSRRAEPWIWSSSDGITWQSAPRDQTAFASLAPVPTREERFDLYLEIQSVIGTSAGFVAVGQDAWCIYGSPFLCTPAAAAVWTSPDGQSWTRVASDPTFVLGSETSVSSSAVFAWGSRFVAVANHGGGTGMWISEGPEGE